MSMPRVAALLVFVAFAAGCEPALDDSESPADDDVREEQPARRADASVPDALVPAAGDGGRRSPPDNAKPGERSDAMRGSEPPIERDGGPADASASAADAGSVTHGKLDAPNYDVVFPKAKVNALTITITPANWQAMLDDMARFWGPRGSPGRPPMGGQMQGGLGGFPVHDPIYVSVTVGFEGLTWSHVGLRFKGNSSLRAAWSSNSDRFPFRMDFDEFEDTQPATKNQRFYGFKTLSLSNNTGDPTHMREALYYDLSAEAGLVTPARGLYEILLDRGEGAKSLGLYTVLEVVRENVIPRHFEEPSGSLFKATQSASNLAANAKASLMSGFEAEGGIGRKEEEADWTKLASLHDALHAPSRTADAAAWRAGLERVLDVPSYLEWLALSTLFQHWDTYGRMPHNYYLYDDPKSQRFHWISWDHNFVLGAAVGGGRGFPGASVSFNKSNAGANWPLITFLYADSTYRRAYDGALTELLGDIFEPSKVHMRVDQLGALLQPYATKSSSSEAYAQALQALKSAVSAQATAARSYLGAAP